MFGDLSCRKRIVLPYLRIDVKWLKHIYRLNVEAYEEHVNRIGDLRGTLFQCYTVIQSSLFERSGYKRLSRFFCKFMLVGLSSSQYSLFRFLLYCLYVGLCQTALVLFVRILRFCSPFSESNEPEGVLLQNVQKALALSVLRMFKRP